MAETTEPNANLNEPFGNVTSEEYDGRTFVHEDNEENVPHYVGVDPIYQNYANEGEKPYPFTKEELVAAAERGGLDADEVFTDGDDEADEGEGGAPESKSEPKSTTTSASKAPATPPAPEPKTASVPTQRTASASGAAKDNKK